MAFPANVLNVLVASPEDPAEERREVQHALQTWNVDHSEQYGIVLLPLLFDDRCYPLHGERPQGLVNTQIVDRADLAVAIFKARVGTPTGAALSGTVEEIERLQQAGKPVMIYFYVGSGIPVPDMDPEQLEARNSLKERLRTQGLDWDYQSVPELRELLSRHLLRVVRDHFAEVATFDERQREEIDRRAKQAATDLLLSARST